MVDLAEVSTISLLSSKRCDIFLHGNLATIQLIIPEENGFEVDLVGTIPWNCKPPASNRTLTTLKPVTTEGITAKR